MRKRGSGREDYIMHDERETGRTCNLNLVLGRLVPQVREAEDSIMILFLREDDQYELEPSTIRMRYQKRGVNV